MIDDFKLGMKMLRYGDHMILQMVGTVICWLGGLILNVWVKGIGMMGISVGSVFMTVAVMFPVQILYSLSVSNLVQSSPAKRRMQTSVPTAVSFVGMMVNYLVCVGIDLIFMALHPEKAGALCSEMWASAIFSVFTMLVLAVTYKYFLASVLLGIVVYFYVRYTFETELVISAFGSGAAAAAAGFVLILLGGLGQYGLSLLCYKAPMSKYAQSANLRKEM